MGGADVHSRFGRRRRQVIPPVPSLFTRFRPYLARFPPVSPCVLRVFTVSARRFQRTPSRNPGPRNGGTRTKTRDLGPSFDTPDANQRINWQTVQSPGEYGWGGAFSTMFFVDPVEQIVMVYMMQSPGDHSLPARHTKRSLRVAVHQAILTDPPQPVPLGTSDTVAARL